MLTRTGRIRLPGNAVGVQQAVADLDEVRKELSKGRTKPCLERARFNRAQLLGLAELVTEIVAHNPNTLETPIFDNRLQVELAVADGRADNEIVRGLGHEDNTRIVGHGAILAGQ
ncbi:MAG: hypothetical protein GY926_01925 [bacterium]|nr:hypothetical protein [bacterium]